MCCGSSWWLLPLSVAAFELQSARALQAAANQVPAFWPDNAAVLKEEADIGDDGIVADIFGNLSRYALKGGSWGEKMNATKPEETISSISGVEVNGDQDTELLLMSMVFSAASTMLLLLAFSCLRWWCPVLYIRDDCADKPESLGFFDWIWMAFSASDKEAEEAAGLDGFLFLEFWSFNCRLFGVLSVVLVSILTPLHLSGQNLYDDLLSRLDIGNMEPQSKFFWVHAALVHVVVGVSVALLRSSYKSARRRHVEWRAALPAPRAVALLVENIPAAFSNDKALLNYFTGLFSKDCVDSAIIVRKTRTLRSLLANVKDTKWQLDAAEEAWTNAGRPKSSEDKVTTARLKLQELMDQINEERKRLEASVEAGDSSVCSNSGIVVFSSRIARRRAADPYYSDRHRHLCVSAAPDPGDIIYEDLARSKLTSDFWNHVGVASLIALFLFWAPVVIFLSGLTNLATMERHVPAVRRFCKQFPELNEVLGRFLTTLALKIFMLYLPGVLFLIARTFKHSSRAHVQVTMERWMFYFLFVFVGLVTLVGRSVVITIFALLNHPTQIFDLLAASMPSTSHFYLSYLSLTWMSPVFPLLRFMIAVKYIYFHYWEGLDPWKAKELAEPEDEAYNGMGSRTAVAVLKTVIALALCTCCPMISIIALIYFMIGHLCYSYLVVHVERRRPDLGGLLPVAALRQTLVGLFLYVALMIGVLSKQAESPWPPLAAAAAMLPVYWAWESFDDRAWTSLSLEEEVEADREAFGGGRKWSRKTPAKAGQAYMQPECLNETKEEVVSAQRWAVGATIL